MADSDADIDADIDKIAVAEKSFRLMPDEDTMGAEKLAEVPAPSWPTRSG
ncbi:hypothetical protein [Massilia sp. GCM10023247]